MIFFFLRINAFIISIITKGAKEKPIETSHCTPVRGERLRKFLTGGTNSTTMSTIADANTAKYKVRLGSDFAKIDSVLERRLKLHDL